MLIRLQEYSDVVSNGSILSTNSNKKMVGMSKEPLEWVPSLFGFLILFVLGQHYQHSRCYDFNLSRQIYRTVLTKNK